MAYTRTTWQDFPNTTTPITATALNNIETAIVGLDRQRGVYTNEAARDAEIGSPTEGMMAYLTAPTVPAAAGDTTAVPSGITTVYNGSAWVCVTNVAAYTSATGTTTSTSFTASLSGSPGTNPSVTVTTGTTALVIVTCELWNNTGGNGSIASVAVSGATTVSAADALGASNAITTAVGSSRTYVATGLTAGNFRYRSLVVKGVA
jgi:hypothetical protein